MHWIFRFTGIECLTIKNTLDTLNVFTHEAQILTHFTLQAALSKINGCQKVERTLDCPWWWHIPCIRLIFNPGPKFGSFHSSYFWHTSLSKMHRMNSEWPWTLDDQEYLVFRKYKLWGPNFVLFCSTTSRFFRYKVKLPEWSQNYLEQLTVQTTLSPCIYLNTSEPEILVCFTLWLCFDIQGCWKLEMHQMTSEWPWKLNTYPWGPNFHLFPSMISHFFLNTRLAVKNWKCTEWLHTDVERFRLSVKSTLYTLNIHPHQAQILVHFTLQPAFSKIQAC